MVNEGGLSSAVCLLLVKTAEMFYFAALLQWEPTVNTIMASEIAQQNNTWNFSRLFSISP